MSDALVAAADAEDKRQYVTDREIVDLVEEWPSYRGSRISPQHVRAWVSQVTSLREQRLLFKLLQRVRFISDVEVQERLRQGHSVALRHGIPTFERKKGIERRWDVLVTYVSGVGKSSADFARRYAKENLIANRCVVEPEKVGAALETEKRPAGARVCAVVVVDDFVGTGRTLAKDICDFVNARRATMVKERLFVAAVAICATEQGEAKIREELAHLDFCHCDFYACETLDSKHSAFGTGSDAWASPTEESEARSLCERLGKELQKRAPLGFAGQGLLVVFQNTCPNNSLPILHRAGTRSFKWKPLFHRPTN